jgi:hypothetical protein
MRFLSIAILSLVAALLLGCAQPPKRADLTIPVHKTKFQLDQQIYITTKVGLFNHVVEFGLLPSTFTAEREDAYGTYFFGEGRVVWNTHDLIQKVPRLLHGGLYIPKASHEAARIFYVFETKVETTDNINAYIQSRISQSAAPPATNNHTPGFNGGATVAGNVVGGAIVSLLLESGVGQLIQVPLQLPSDASKQIGAALIPAKTGLPQDSKQPASDGR